MDEIINLSTTLSVILQLGRVGENNANEITFDFSDWQSEFGEGTVSLVCKRPTDAEGYPVSLTVSGTEATWLVSSTDVAYEGLGQAQITYTVNGVIKKSVIYMTRTCPSIEPVSSAPPDPYASWLDQMIEAKEDAEAARDEAVEVAGDLTDMAKTFPALLVTGSSSGSIATFDDGSETPVKSLSVNIDPVQEGSGDPSPDNIRPISGWDGVNVTVTGKNLLRNEMRQNNADNVSIGKNTVYTRYDIPLKGGTYTLSVKVSQAFSGYMREEKDSNNTSLGNVIAETGGILTKTITLNEGLYSFWLYKNGGLDASKIEWFQLELGSTATSYEPYKGTVYPISLPQTVYGGVLDVENGTLTVDRAMVDMGTLPWSYLSSSNIFICVLAGSKPEINLPILTTIYKQIPTRSHADMGNADDNTIAYYISTGDTSGRIKLKNTAYTTVDAFTSAMSGIPLVYPLATPLTLSLTPTEVRTILGYNNIYADSGEVSVVYYRDLDIVINRLLEGSASL